MKIPYIQVRNDCLIYYEIPAVRPGRAYSPLKSKTYSSQVTKGATTRIKKAIDILLQKAQPRIIYNSVTKKHHPFTINFVTLTVSDHKNIGIREGYDNLLKPFLRKIRSTGKLSYIWKAEYQERGQLHYHLTTNQFLPVQKLRNDWNNLQRKNRYLDSFATRFGHYDPNSTDVHAVHQVKNISAYLAKYMSKPVIDPGKQFPGKKPVYEKGKIWDCSKDLKTDRFSYIMDSRTDTALRQAIDQGKVKQINLDHCTIFKLTRPTDILPIPEYKQYIKWKS